MKLKNKELIQSYLVTTAKYDFSVYEKRILYRVIEAIQFELQGKKLNDTFIIDGLYGDKTVKIPISSFLVNEEDHNHTRIKKALTDLRNKTIEIDDKREWRLFGIIDKPVIKKYDSTVEFIIDRDIYAALLNFAKGFRKYDLKVAYEFESVYSMRFYELISEQKNKQRYPIEWLKERFKIQNKYTNRPSEFIRYVIEFAKKELDKKSPYSFDYELIYDCRKIVAIDLYPKHIVKNEDPEFERAKLIKKTSPQWVINNYIINALKEKFGFTKSEIEKNLILFESAQELMDDFLLFITTKHGKSAHLEPNKAKGWFINAVKGELKLLKQLDV